MKEEIIKRLTEFVNANQKSDREEKEYLLLKAIKSDQSLDIFNDHFQRFCNSEFPINYQQLISWMEASSNRIGAQKCVEKLYFYVNSELIKIEYIELIINTIIETEYSFCNGIKISTLDKISNKALGATLNNESYTVMTPFPKVTSVFVGEIDQAIIHKSTKNHKINPFIEAPHNDVEEVKLCISLSRHSDYGIYSLAGTFSVSEDLPILQNGRSWQNFSYKHPPIQPTITKPELKRADKILRNFKNLDASFRERLKIPMNKLNDFGSRSNPIENAIDLRTCIESIFLGENDSGQISFRLSLRASLFFGGDLKERQLTFSLFKRVYSSTSRAVHNGKFSKKDKLEDLSQVAELARKALIRLIDDGPIDWEQLELK